MTFRPSTHTRGDGVLLNMDEFLEKQIASELQRIEERAKRKAALLRVPCLAKTRKGHPCKNKE